MGETEERMGCGYAFRLSRMPNVLLSYRRLLLLAYRLVGS